LEEVAFFNILYREGLNLEIKLYIYIVFKSWTEKLNFSVVANILKISVYGFFPPKIKRWGTNGPPSCSKTEGFEIKFLHNIRFMLYIVEYHLKLVAYD
jgi:hypothetical protein